MITVQRENGDVIFINEHEHIHCAYKKDERKFIAIPTQPTANTGIPRDRTEVEDVVCVAYTNEAQPISLTFQADKSPTQPAEYESEKVMVLYKEIDRIDIIERDEQKKKHPGWGHYQKSGNGVRFLSACRANNIDTIGQLLTFGRVRFEETRNMGRMCCDVITKALTNLYGIEKW
jgi:hypothetical protein